MKTSRAIGSGTRIASATFVCVLTSMACGNESQNNQIAIFETTGVASALESISPGAIEAHIRVLADDSLAGRAPGTEGYEGASRYVESVFTTLGLQPAGDGGGFKQNVPLQESSVNEVGVVSRSRPPVRLFRWFMGKTTISPPIH